MTLTFDSYQLMSIFLLWTCAIFFLGWFVGQRSERIRPKGRDVAASVASFINLHEGTEFAPMWTDIRTPDDDHKFKKYYLYSEPL